MDSQCLSTVFQSEGAAVRAKEAAAVRQARDEVRHTAATGRHGVANQRANQHAFSIFNICYSMLPGRTFFLQCYCLLLKSALKLSGEEFQKEGRRSECWRNGCTEVRKVILLL